MYVASDEAANHAHLANEHRREIEQLQRRDDGQLEVENVHDHLIDEASDDPVLHSEEHKCGHPCHHLTNIGLVVWLRGEHLHEALLLDLLVAVHLQEPEPQGPEGAVDNEDQHLVKDPNQRVEELAGKREQEHDSCEHEESRERSGRAHSGSIPWCRSPFLTRGTAPSANATATPFLNF